MHPFIAEFIGTAILILLGAGVVANVSLRKTYAENQSPLVLITSAWGFAVFVAVYITSKSSGAHLNPAVSIGTCCGREIFLVIGAWLFYKSNSGRHVRKLVVLSDLFRPLQSNRR